MKLVRDGENGGRGYKGGGKGVWRRGEGGMEVGGEGDYIPTATLSPPE